MQKIQQQLSEMNCTLLAFSPQLQAKNQELIKKHKLSFDVCRDEANAYAAQLGLAYPFSDALKGVYSSVGIDLAQANGEDSWTLPVPARLVIDSSGLVRVADIDIDYTRRPEPEKTVADVAEL